METEEETTTPEPTPEPHPTDDLSTVVHALREKVDGLVTEVHALTARLDDSTPVHPDSTPHSVPWTHRKFS